MPIRNSGDADQDQDQGNDGETTLDNLTKTGHPPCKSRRGGKDAPSRNPNAYPMTDETTFPSTVSILVDGKLGRTLTLPDDPADHRGVLSWHHQLKDRKLREAGSYGYLTRIDITAEQLGQAAERRRWRGHIWSTVRSISRRPFINPTGRILGYGKAMAC